MRPAMPYNHTDLSDDPVVRASREMGMSDEEKLAHRRQKLANMHKNVEHLRNMKATRHRLQQKFDACKRAQKNNHTHDKEVYESLKQGCLQASAQRNLVVAEIFAKSEALRKLTKSTEQEQADSVAACKVATELHNEELHAAIELAKHRLDDDLHIMYTQNQFGHDHEWAEDELNLLEKRALADNVVKAPTNVHKKAYQQNPSRYVLRTLEEKAEHLRKYKGNTFHVEPNEALDPDGTRMILVDGQEHRGHLAAVRWFDYKKVHAYVLADMRLKTQQLLEQAKIHTNVFKEHVQREKSRWF